MAYKRIARIQLHNSSTIIDDPHYGPYGNEGRAFIDETEKAEWSISYLDIDNVLNALGYALPNRFSKGTLKDQTIPENYLYSAEFNVYKKYNRFSDHQSEDVEKIECEIISAQMVNIRITERAEHGDENITIMTHCGSFTIWWITCGDESNE